MWGSMADHHHYRSMGIYPLGHFEIINAVVSDQVCEIVLETNIQHKTFAICIIHQKESYYVLYSATVNYEQRQCLSGLGFRIWAADKALMDIVQSCDTLPNQDLPR